MHLITKRNLTKPSKESLTICFYIIFPHISPDNVLQIFMLYSLQKVCLYQLISVLYTKQKTTIYFFGHLITIFFFCIYFVTKFIVIGNEY